MQTAIRDSIVGYLNPLYTAAYPAVPVVYDNGPFDWNDTPEMFVEVETEFYAGEQVYISESPLRRVSGCVYVSVHAKAGSGTRASLGIIDWFSEALKFRTVGSALLQAPEPEQPETYPGWYVSCLKVPFYSKPG